jgi:hypothetical protein
LAQLQREVKSVCIHSNQAARWHDPNGSGNVESC